MSELFGLEQIKAAKDSLTFAGDFEAFWEIYPKRDGADPRKPAAIAFARARKRATLETIMAALRRDLDHWTAAGKVGTRFIPHATTWLNAEPWIAKAGSGKVDQATELAAAEARDIRSFSQLEVALRRFGLPMGEANRDKRREFCIRNGINPSLLNG